MATSTAYPVGFQCAGAIVEQLRSSLGAPCQKQRTSPPSLGYMCTYVPEEIIHAAGFAALRILPGTAPAFIADAWLPGFCCAVARGCLARSLSGELDQLSGLVFASTCDTMQCLGDIWGMARPQDQIVDIDTPTHLDSHHVMSYLTGELSRFAHEVAAISGRAISFQTLWQSIRLYNRKRQLLRQLEDSREHLNSTDYLVVINAGFVLPVEAYVALLEQLTIQLSEESHSEVATGIPLMISGALLEDTTVHELLDELGGRVVGDDLCNGSRYYDTLVAESGDPFEALAVRYLHRAPCPCKHAPAHSRLERLRGMVRCTEASGIIFALHKFCEPHAFDYPYLAHTLEEEGIPSLLLEVESTSSRGQLRTRLQAFLEILSL